MMKQSIETIPTTAKRLTAREFVKLARKVRTYFAEEEKQFHQSDVFNDHEYHYTTRFLYHN